jgi:NAD(P)-dependent dehydrogenase (short-subunit alcohol dehydrogenase family)
MLLKGKTAIIAGASQGLGLSIAKAFLKAGANIAICARNQELLNKASLELNQNLLPGQKILSYAIDITHSNDVERMVQNVMERLGQIDILLISAAIQGPMGAFETQSYEEWSDTIDINLKGVFNCCRYVAPHMKEAKYGKIILLSGGGATKARPYFSAYAASKVAVVRFGETIAEELRPYHIDVNSIAPGVMNTRLMDEMLAAGPEVIGREYHDLIKQKDSSDESIRLSSSLSVFLASNLSDGISGKLISAKWDPWQNLPKYIEAMQSSDVYTLRRILPEDRALVLESCE